MKAPTVTSPLEQVTHLASHHSSLLAVFDTAKLAGFPSPSPALLSYESAKVWSLQSRLGAGSSLAGYIRSADAHLTKPTTALISTPTLPLLLPALHELPEVTTRGNRLVIHLSVSLPPADRPLDAPSASLAQITPLLPLLPESFAVVFSSTPEDIIRNTAAVYEDAAFSRSNVLHVVEGVFAGRELVKKETLSSPAVLDTFTYSGSADATKVIVLPASYSSALLRSTTLPSAGVLTINVLGPWPTNSFMDALPNGGKDVQELVVVEESESEDGTDVLKEMVVGAVFGRAGTSGGKVPKITGALIKGGETSLGSLLLSVGVPFQLPTKKSVVKQSLFLTSTESLLPHLLTKTFLSSPSLKTRLSTLTSTIPSLNQSTLLIAPSNASSAKSPFTSYPAASSSSLIFVSQAAALTQTRSAFASLAQNGTILISLPGWDHSTVAENLSPADRKTLKSKNARLFVLPPTSKDVSEAEETALGLVGFFLLYAGIGQGGKLPESVRALVESSLGHLGEFIGRAEENLTEINVSTLTTTAEEDEQEEKRSDLSLDALPSFPSAAPSSSASSSDTSKPFTASWHSPALHLLFKESFAPNASAPLKSHTPASHDKTYLATVTENRRLTPVTYDRNVFHLELSTAGTGLKYDVGEALGVHGWNDEQETREFLEWYGVSPNTIISIPIEGGKKVETRTALQIFQQRVDIFGRPGKAFYAALVGKTKNREEARQLRFISSAEGSPMFKKWSENETVTFVDVLQRFPGLKENVSIEELVELVGEIHPRHYSISSAQKFVGDAVHLLVVTVEWDSTLGKPRYGQCTRYMAGLKVGQQVTVSIKPSVMKLPPLDTQPVIMAGLGTGAAPFRAFIQHRAWQRSQGMEVGPLVYYFGARNSSQEYLYGEEIEAYLRGGILTHAGLAFSRDTAKKVYIQHKMLEDGPLLSGMLTAEKEEDKAYFYLCGPTWPVPDVYAALVGSLEKNQSMEKTKAEAYIEELKEAERYVLEVY